jgi:hypothetical protein
MLKYISSKVSTIFHPENRPIDIFSRPGRFFLDFFTNSIRVTVRVRVAVRVRVRVGVGFGFIVTLE